MRKFNSKKLLLIGGAIVALIVLVKKGVIRNPFAKH